MDSRKVYVVASPIFIAKAFSSTVGVTLAAKENIVREMVLLEPPWCADSRFLATLCFGGGCFSFVFSNAIAAAACCAFLMEGPDAMYSSSPTSRQTVKVFLWAGPDSSVSWFKVERQDDKITLATKYLPCTGGSSCCNGPARLSGTWAFYFLKRKMLQC